MLFHSLSLNALGQILLIMILCAFGASYIFLILKLHLWTQFHGAVCSAPNLFFSISDLRFQTRCLIFAAHRKFFLALNVCSPFNDCPSHLIESTQYHASLKLYCDWFTPNYVVVHVIVVCLPHLFFEFEN